MPGSVPTHEDVERLAYQLWEERGRPPGLPEVDWHRAERELSSSSHMGSRYPGGAANGASSDSSPHRTATDIPA